MSEDLKLYGVVSPANWTVAVIDGQPEEVVNLAGMAEMVRSAPIGRRKAMRNLRGRLPADIYRRLVAELEGTSK